MTTNSQRLYKIQRLAENFKRDYPDWRTGQCAFNALNAVNPDLAAQVQRTARDPYYLDDALPNFWAYVTEYYTEADSRLTYGRCMACGAVEVKLNRVTGYINIPEESDRYPTGFGCEVCD